MAEMLTDLLQSIYNRISQLGKTIKSLQDSLDSLNKNIENKVNTLNQKLSQFSKEIDVTQTKHLEVLERIGNSATEEIEKIEDEIGVSSIKQLTNDLENFSKLSEEILNQETVEMLLSEAISTVKQIKKEQLGIVEEEAEEK
jgi:phosphate uptake regulator